jgi:hypothetical protein
MNILFYKYYYLLYHQMSIQFLLNIILMYENCRKIFVIYLNYNLLLFDLLLNINKMNYNLIDLYYYNQMNIIYYLYLIILHNHYRILLV